MDDKGAKMAAISAAIAVYLEEEQARLTALPQPRPPVPVSMWRMFGRWQAMRTR
jgi:hypothetical protein